MDTTWFAVDAAGQVAVFETGEDGHAPDGDENDVVSELEALLGRTLDGGDEDDFRRHYSLLGLYAYEYGDADLLPIGTYHRTATPEVPLHIDQLPPAIRASVRTVTFTGLRFGEAERVQPMELFPCVYWYDDIRFAYLCADGKTVKPVPGMEARFADFVREFRTESPDVADGLVFDGPEQGDAKPPAE